MGEDAYMLGYFLGEADGIGSKYTFASSLRLRSLVVLGILSKGKLVSAFSSISKTPSTS